MLLRRAVASLVGAVVLLSAAAGPTWGQAAADAKSARVAAVFQDNMVLQRDMPVPVWGWAAPGEAVEVKFAGQAKQATADPRGRWKVTLDPLAASNEGRPLEVRLGDAAVTRKNVLVGEVWVAAGQSNMVAGGPDRDTGVYPYVPATAAAGKPEVRLTEFGGGASLEPLDDLDPAAGAPKAWAVMPEGPAPDDTAPTQYFARALRDELGVPVGVIRIAVPGTNQGAWLARQTLESFPAVGGDKPNTYEQLLADMIAKLAESNLPNKTWDDMRRAEEAWRNAPKGRSPSSALPYWNFPTALYNTRVHPLAPLAFRGVIWHQGEAGPRGPYGDRLVAMARQWRQLFGHDFYFVWGTLSRTTTTPPPLAPVRTSFYRSLQNLTIREALPKFGDDKRVAMVELYDLGNDVTHFLQKAEAGRRFALAAAAVAYGKPTVYTGPRLAESKLEGGRAVLRFECVGDGLKYEPSVDGISGFYVRGKAGDPRWADVKVVGRDTLELSHPDVPEIATIAYAAASNPHETLFNSAGLPASPFGVNVPEQGDRRAAYELLALREPNGGGATLHIAHVRRGGYVFQLKPADAKARPAGPVTLTAYVPAEWKEFVVESAGKPLATTPADQDAKDGRRFVTFQAPVDGAWIIVAEKGSVEALRKVNRY